MGGTTGGQPAQQDQGAPAQQQGMRDAAADGGGAGGSGLPPGMENGGQYWQHMQQQEQLLGQGFPGLMGQPGAMAYPYFGQVGQGAFVRAQPHAAFFDPQRGYVARPGMLPNGAIPQMPGSGADIGGMGGPLNGNHLQQQMQQNMGRGRPFAQGMIGGPGGVPDFRGVPGGGEGEGPAPRGEAKGRKAPKRSLAATIERMEKHKILERKRREKTKELMSELQGLIPTEQGDMGDSPTMNTVLEEAIEHLKNIAWEAQHRAKHPCSCGAPGVGSNPMPQRPRDRVRERDEEEEEGGAGRKWSGSEQFAGAGSSGEGGEEEAQAKKARKTEKPPSSASGGTATKPSA